MRRVYVHSLVWRCLAILMTMLLPGQALAKSLTEAEVRALQGKMKSTDTLTVDFVQTSFKAFRGSTTTRQGQAIFARPDKFKWMLETPVKEYRLYDGTSFYDYTPDGKTARRYTPTGPSAHELKGIVDLVLNFDTLLRRYELVKAEEHADLVAIELKPQSTGEVVKVELRLSTKDSFITYLRMELKNKNTLTHQFSNPRRAAVPAGTFALPPGVKVEDSN